MLDLNAEFAAAVAKHQAGDVAAAETQYRAILSQFPAHTPTLCNLGVLLARSNRLQEAANCYNLALAATPGYPDAHFNLGNIYRRSNQLAEAAAQYRACLMAHPTHAAAAYNLGLVLSAVGDLSGAIECFQLVTQQETTNADAFGRLGDTLLRAGQLVPGVAAFRRAVELKPNDPRALHNLGLGLSSSGQTLEAQELLQKALKLKPDYAEAHNALGLNLEAMGRKDDAMFHYQEAVRLKPDLADGWSNLGTNLGEQGRVEEAINCLRESLNVRPQAAPIHSNLLLMLNYSSQLTPDQVLADHLAWGERFGGPTPSAPAVPLPHDATRRLRLGYLSADFRAHTVAAFIETLFTHHDRDRVEVFAYANVVRPDETTNRLKNLADQWRAIGGWPDDQVFDQMRRDELDVLIDLGGHTAGNRLAVLAARPAPVQATLFGYPNTTGLKAVDYRITDPISDPPGRTEGFYAEGLLRLPDVAWVYRPPATLPPVTPLPAMTKRPFTLGCLNNPAKISEACLAAWTRLLQSTPGTRLVLLAGQAQSGAKRLMSHFMQAGILRDRIELVMRLPKEKYFEAYSQFDLALDPFPYNGGVTTCDALVMGVPVLTLAGTSYVSRQGVLQMSAVGLPDFIADSPEDLGPRVKEWMNRRAELAQIRAGLRDRLLESPMTDGPRYVQNLENSLRTAWRKHIE